jgi:hypothetical protein
MQIWLFDLDGVLIEPLGYRQSVLETMRHLFPQPFYAHLLPDYDDFDEFEAAGIISEWDMVAISTFLIANQIMLSDASLSIPENPQELRWLPGIKPPDVINYRSWINSFAGSDFQREDPSTAFFCWLVNNVQSQARLRDGLLDSSFAQLLKTTRDLDLSLTTRIFQNFCLGDRLFRQTYNREPEVVSPSLLALHDVPGITPEQSHYILDLIDQGVITAVAMTARPSRMTGDSGSTNDLSSSPEAEQALQLVGLSSIPVIGLGFVNASAAAGNFQASALIKPQAFHSLAAILVAAGNSFKDAIQIGLDLIATGESSQLNDELHGAKISIFEDSPAGLESMLAAERILSTNGIQIHLRLFGIANNPGKKNALEKLGAVVYQDACKALQAAWVD